MQSSPRGECQHSSWHAFNACSEGNRHQLAPLLACTVELGVFLTARAPHRRRSSPAFGGCDDAGPRSPNTGRENGHDHFARHRPRGAAARRRRVLLQTSGLSWKGGCSLAGSLARLRHTHRSRGCRRRVDAESRLRTRLRDGLAPTTSRGCTRGSTPASIGPPRWTQGTVDPLSCATRPENGLALWMMPRRHYGGG